MSLAKVSTIIFIVLTMLVAICKYVEYRKMINNHVERSTTDVWTNFGKIDIGQVKSDTVLSFNYKMINIGQDTLQVLFISPDCNCTYYNISQKKAVVGDSIMLKLKIDMRNKQKGRFMLNTIVGLNTNQRLYTIIVEGDVL